MFCRISGTTALKGLKILVRAGRACYWVQHTNLQPIQLQEDVKDVGAADMEMLHVKWKLQYRILSCQIVIKPVISLLSRRFFFWYYMKKCMQIWHRKICPAIFQPFSVHAPPTMIKHCFNAFAHLVTWYLAAWTHCKHTKKTANSGVPLQSLLFALIWPRNIYSTLCTAATVHFLQHSTAFLYGVVVVVCMIPKCISYMCAPN